MTRTTMPVWTKWLIIVLGACAPLRAFADDAIHIAAFAGNLDKIRALLDQDPKLVESRNSEQETPLHRAACGGHAAAVELLLQRGADINSKAYNEFTPLHLAADAAVAKILIKAGADLNGIDAWGKTPMQMAVQERKLDVVDAILESGQSLDLTSAVMLNKRDLALDILKRDPDSLKRLDGGSDLWGNTTPLGIVAGRGDKELVELFLNAGADVNGSTFMPNAGGSATPLCNAVWGDHTDIVKYLFEHGASWEGVGGKFYDSIFQYAVQNSDTKIVELFLLHGAKIEKTWPTGVPRTSLLCVAAQRGNLKMLQLILDHSAGVFDKQDEQIAMLDAAEAGHREIVEFLRGRGGKYDIVIATILDDQATASEILQHDRSLINVKDDRLGRPVLSWAIAHSLNELANRLIVLGADVNANTVPEEHYARTLRFGPPKDNDKAAPRTFGETPLLLAIQMDNGQMVQRLLDSGARFNARDGLGQTPLHTAVEKSSAEAMKHLIAHGADVNAKDNQGNTPLHLSFRSGEIAELLVQAGAEINVTNQNGLTPLDWAVGWKESHTAGVLLAHGATLKLVSACILGNVDFVKSAIEADPAVADAPIGNDKSESPLVIAALHGRVEIVRLLLEHGATMNYNDDRRTTPLHAAAEGGNTEIVKLLLDHGADLAASSYQGTALHRAAMYGQLEVVKLLVQRGADVNQDAELGGWTPLHATAWSDSAEVAEYLVAQGADVNHRLLRGGGTPLHETTMKGGVNVARVLLAHGAEVNAKDSGGETPLSQAKRHNVYENEDANIKSKRAQLVELLQSKGGVE